MDSGDTKMLQEMKDDITEENGELSDHGYGLNGNLVFESYGENEGLSDDIEGNIENNEIVRLVPVECEDDENYVDEHISEDHDYKKDNAADNSELVNTEDFSSQYEATIDKDVANDYSYEDAIAEPTFHKSDPNLLM